MGAAALGLSVIAARSALAFTAIKLAGACYLAYLGVRALLNARGDRGHGLARTAEPGSGSAERHAGHGSPDAAVSGRRDSFVQGLLSNVLNPKAALFFLSVLPQFVHHGGSAARQIFLLGTLDIAIGVVYWLALVSAAAHLRSLLDRPVFRRRWEQATGWLFIALGIGVAATE